MANVWTRLDDRLAQRIPELWKFIKFSLAGQLSTLVEMLVFYLLQYVAFKNILDAPLDPNGRLPAGIAAALGLTKGRGYFYAYVISIAIGYAIAYVLNRKISFKADANVFLSTSIYIVMVIFTILAGSYMGTFFSTLFVAHGWQAVGNIVVKPITALIPTLWTYPMNRFVIHRHKKENLPGNA
jgi:putative flippase GtrA